MIEFSGVVELKLHLQKNFDNSLSGAKGSVTFCALQCSYISPFISFKSCALFLSVFFLYLHCLFVNTQKYKCLYIISGFDRISVLYFVCSSHRKDLFYFPLLSDLKICIHILVMFCCRTASILAG